MATLKVQVNPDNPDDFLTEDDAVFGHAKLSGWPVFELKIPKPRRVFRMGDVVADGDTLRWVRGTGDYWFAPTASFTYPHCDETIGESHAFTYVGNVFDMQEDD